MLSQTCLWPLDRGNREKKQNSCWPLHTAGQKLRCLITWYLLSFQSEWKKVICLKRKIQKTSLKKITDISDCKLPTAVPIQLHTSCFQSPLQPGLYHWAASPICITDTEIPQLHEKRNVPVPGEPYTSCKPGQWKRRDTPITKNTPPLTVRVNIEMNHDITWVFFWKEKSFDKNQNFLLKIFWFCRNGSKEFLGDFCLGILHLKFTRKLHQVNSHYKGSTSG